MTVVNLIMMQWLIGWCKYWNNVFLFQHRVDLTNRWVILRVHINGKRHLLVAIVTIPVLDFCYIYKYHHVILSCGIPYHWEIEHRPTINDVIAKQTKMILLLVNTFPSPAIWKGASVATRII